MGSFQLLVSCFLHLFLESFRSQQLKRYIHQKKKKTAEKIHYIHKKKTGEKILLVDIQYHGVTQNSDLLDPVLILSLVRIGFSYQTFIYCWIA